VYVEAQSAHGRVAPTTDQPPTLLDVARASGFSKATVAKVATGNFFVSETTRESIEQAAAEIGYVWCRDQPRGVKRRARRRTPLPVAEPRSSRITSRLHLVDLKAAIVVESMPRDDVIQYELEGVLPMADSGVASLADEDYDPAPVPTGCPGCWRTFDPDGGGPTPCFSCPSPPSKQELREHQKLAADLLTPRERSVAELVVAGEPTAQIARRMGWAPNSVRKYRSSLYAKLSTDADGLVSALTALGVASPS
jgi:DNA-binding CsgD family transcriptional regulator